MSCASCFGGITTGQVAHAAELPKPGRLESFTLSFKMFKTFKNYIIILLKLCRHGDVGLQKYILNMSMPSSNSYAGPRLLAASRPNKGMSRQTSPQ